MPRSIFSLMKRPITSPWSAVFTSSATITLIPSGALGGLVGARDLVVVGHGDGPEPGRLRRLEQHVHRGRAVKRVVGVHVQVHVDELARSQLLAHRRLAVDGAPPARDPPVDLLELIRHAVPAQPVVGGMHLAVQLVPQATRRRSGAEAGRPGCRRRAARTAVPARRRRGPPRIRAAARRRARLRPRLPAAGTAVPDAVPAEAATAICERARCCGLRAVGRARDGAPAREVRAEGLPRPSGFGSRDQTVACHGSCGGQACRSARRKTRSGGALLLGGEEDVDHLASGRAVGARPGRRRA